MVSSPPENTTREVAKGFFASAALNIVVASVLWGISTVGTGVQAAVFLLIFMGGTQLIYLLPWATRANARKRHSFAKGIVIAIGVTILLNASCWVVVAIAMSPLRS